MAKSNALMAEYIHTEGACAKKHAEKPTAEIPCIQKTKMATPQEQHGHFHEIV